MEINNENYIKKQVIQLKQINGVTRQAFLDEVYPKRVPMIFTGLDIGPCREKWTTDYLAQFGGSADVKIHVSASHQLDFINKNFLYRSLPFDKFVRRAANEDKQFFLCENECYYLRALGDDPRKDIAKIDKQFPRLAQDIVFPDFFDGDSVFSSVFRIASAKVQLWTHYDVMDNLLIQVTGRKRVVLFSPKEVENLYIVGDKSQVLDIDNPDLTQFPKFANVQRYEGMLNSGDILFIPALWFHNIISLEFGVAVNVFWRHLPKEVYDHKDVYGNRDPLPAARATQIVDRALKTLEELPREYADFYARLLIERIKRKAFTDDSFTDKS
ncbi:tRNA wybutosine-synthesizing protein 5-like [Gigantopelta aegis]|uniref:tRNA wybutosine-synthesizing protein 5-like n=1 Tax=Gigantopelta aegis TaxID=1735272 RepID=UPI001B88894C|nr:tRNA wybutosine-synthesizing protein 5-like [Gigantopelta aegis]XP_041374823.1 tRNA wybutosine-synthesizing protein 5-like [Gigantopelta aegis]XP_041374824.1 tRNA wybutosine-synthesizing protein 5-like [Gigantopelta aegis]